MQLYAVYSVYSAYYNRTAPHVVSTAAEQLVTLSFVGYTSLIAAAVVVSIHICTHVQNTGCIHAVCV